jgi:hypothetical protein
VQVDLVSTTATPFATVTHCCQCELDRLSVAPLPPWVNAITTMPGGLLPLLH